MCKFIILVINPGSTSTKIAIFENEEEKFSQTLYHDEKEINSFKKIADQYPLRMKTIANFLIEKSIDLKSIDAVVGRGGLLHPIEGGTYEVGPRMLEDLKKGVSGEHASNLGGILAHEIGTHCNAPAFIVDPVVVDEMDDIARLSGMKELPRKSIFHALNHKAVARIAAKEMGGKYSDFNFIIAHMGGGISIAAHKKGRVVDVNNALDGEGPFTPERAGTLPAGDLVRLCFSGKYTKEEINKKIKGQGGMVAYLGTNDMRKVHQMVDEDNGKARLIYEAMAYQCSKEICALAAVLEGKVDGIILTGGVAYDDMFVGWIKKRVSFLAPILVFPGEEEMRALALGALRVLRGDEKAHIYE